jgi:hypothetical protein
MIATAGEFTDLGDVFSLKERFVIEQPKKWPRLFRSKL